MQARDKEIAMTHPDSAELYLAARRQRADALGRALQSLAAALAGRVAARVGRLAAGLDLRSAGRRALPHG